MKKKNNKGFSLVELIVVIAIMAILAVTLAPRLSQYVEKSRKASDQEAINTIFTAAKLANLEDPLGTDVDPINLGDDLDALFTVSESGKRWEISENFPADGEDNELFWKTIKDILGDFELKSTKVNGNTSITLKTDEDGKITVTLEYDGIDTYDENVPDTGYQVAE